MFGAVIGAVADTAGQVLNDATQQVIMKDKTADYEELVAPVPQEMMDKYPGLELLMLPNQVQMVLQQKIEVAEVLATMVNMAQDEMQFNVETPNKYAVKQKEDGTLLYIIAERSNDCEGYCQRANCRTCMPFNFDIISARSKQIVASVESPWACDNLCCGMTYCCCPACCCLRGATFYQVSGGPDGQKVPIASVQEQCSTEQCGCVHKYAVSYPENTSAQPFALEIKTCGAALCDCSANVLAEANITDESHPYETPLGRVWPKIWINDYEPTNERYPGLPAKSVGEVLVDLAKQVVKEIFTDADTYMMECPHDGAPEKAALITGVLINDMCYHETQG